MRIICYTPMPVDQELMEDMQDILTALGVPCEVDQINEKSFAFSKFPEYGQDEIIKEITERGFAFQREMVDRKFMTDGTVTETPQISLTTASGELDGEEFENIPCVVFPETTFVFAKGEWKLYKHRSEM